MTNQQIADLFIEYYGEERVDFQHDMRITIHYPKTIIKNENDEQHMVEDLYVSFAIRDGRLDGLFDMIRTTYSKNDYLHHYAHSHLPRIGDVPTWEVPCRGSGPINATISRLNGNNSEDDWLIFARELEQYVTIESLAGGPYIRMSELSQPIRSRNSYREVINLNNYSRPQCYLPNQYRDLAKKVIERRVLPLTYNGEKIIIAEPILKSLLKIRLVHLEDTGRTVSDINNAVLPNDSKWTFKPNNVLMKKWDSDEDSSTGSDLDAMRRVNGELLFAFKGKDVRLVISDIDAGTEQPEEIHHSSNEIVLCAPMACQIYAHILYIVNQSFTKLVEHE